MDNPFLMGDPTARHVFVTLLLLADRKTGSWSGGRKQLAAFVGMNDMTVYHAITRLNREQIVNSTSNNKWTTHYICKWSIYQTQDEQPVNSIRTDLEHSNKKEKEKEKENTLDSYPNVRSTDLVGNREKYQNFKYKILKARSF